MCSGGKLTIMTLGGLAIAIGEIVDDAVIDVENIFRRLRENQGLERPRSAFQVVLDASVEVRGAVVYATFAVLLVFVPILTLSGVTGRIFAPLGEAYLFAVLASLLVALTVTRGLCLALLRGAPGKEPETPSPCWLPRSARAAQPPPPGAPARTGCIGCLTLPRNARWRLPASERCRYSCRLARSSMKTHAMQ
jgi:Cu/Ag efflux pump CusA